MLTVKIYNRTFTALKETLKWDLILSDISFSANTNWWQWEITLQINKSITTTDYALWDIVKIWKYDEETKQWVNLYMWYVTRLWRKQTTSRQFIELNCLWMASILSEHPVSKSYDNKPVWQIMREIIDAVNSSYWWNVINYTMLTIPDWPLMWTWSISQSRASDWITALANSQWKKRFVDWNWTAHLFDTPVSPTHELTNQKDVENIDIKEEIQEMVNSVYFWSEFDVTQNTTYEDAASVALYWKKYLQQSINIFWQTALDNYAIQYVNDRKDPKKQSTLIVNRKYPIETIRPWDTVKIRNFEYTFNNISIEKIQYTQDRIILYLDMYLSFWWQIKSIVSN